MKAIDLDLLRRQRASQRAFYRALSGGSPHSRLLDLDGAVQATVVPVRPWFSIFNSVLYEDVFSLERALPALEDAYASAGVKAWTVWFRLGIAVQPSRLKAPATSSTPRPC